MKKIITLLLAVIMLFSIVACANESGKTNDGNKNQNTNEKLWIQKDLDFEGFEFNIMSAAPGGTISTWDGSDIESEEVTGNEVLDAVYYRNRLIEETYNCTISWVDAIDAASVKTVLMAGNEEDASMLSRQLWETFDLIEAGYLCDLNDASFKHLDLSKDWYSQTLQRDITIGGKLYAVCGDMLFTDEVGMWITLFNKSLASKYMPDINLYDEVRKGNWTIDMLNEYAALATTELVADDTWTYEDQWGYLAESYNVIALISAAGRRLAELTPDGGIKINVFDTDFQEVFTKCFETVDKRYCLMVDDIKASGNVWDTYNATFYEGRVLFMITSMYRSINFREMSTDFGILPLPKLNQDQENYYTWSTYNINVVSIPYTCSDPERTSAIMEALFEESSYKLQPAFSVNALRYQSTRDDDSIEMLDIIMDNTIYDIGVIYNFGNTCSTLTSIVSSRSLGSISSKLKKLETSANRHVADLMETLGLQA